MIKHDQTPAASCPWLLPLLVGESRSSHDCFFAAEIEGRDEQATGRSGSCLEWSPEA